MSVHIFYGYAKRRCPDRPRCMYCNKRRTWVAFTYFGAPVCGDCWDSTWRKTEDGECDPPFDAIKNEVSGEWLAVAPPAEDAPLTAGDYAAAASDMPEKLDAEGAR